MNTTHWLSPDEHGDWDAFVSRHQLGLVYHLSSWQRTLETAFGHIRGRFLALKDAGGQIQAGLPVYTVRSWLLGNRTVSVPFSTMCDPLVSTKEQFDLLWPAIEDTAAKHSSRRIEIRAMHTTKEQIQSHLAASVKYKHHYLPLGETADALFSRFNRTSIRRWIQRARRAGVTVEERQDEQSMCMFYELLIATRRRHSLPSMPFAFFQAMYSSLSPNRVALYLAVHAGEPVGGLLVSKFKNLWTAEYIGYAENPIKGISQALYWETIQHAKSSGAAYYSFGRTSVDNTGLLDHKRRWGTVEGDLVDFISQRGSTSERGNRLPETDGLVRKRSAMRFLVRYAPGVLQKHIGNFCYRHLG